MVIGENLKDMEVEINITKDKALNNIRTKAHEE
jgi:predicted membrane GTPase involved in stress response